VKIRLRKPLRYYDRRAAELGYEVLLFTVPARTTLEVSELWTDNVLCFTEDGKRFLVSREKIREHGYLPRSSRAAGPTLR
jgi:hypothetical protein